MIRAVIFDMDGLIVDTEMPEYLCWKEIYESYGVTVTPEEWTVQVGIREGAFHPAAELARRCGQEIDCEAMSQEYRRRYLARLQEEFTPRPGFQGLLASLVETGTPRAIASASSRDWVEFVTNRLGIEGKFNAIVCGDDVARGKPHPDVYLLAAARLGVAPEECLALEDSAPGIQAARAAGMVCIAVPNALTRHQDLSAAHCLLESLDAVAPHLAWE